MRRYAVSLNAERSETQLAPRQRVQRIRAATLFCAALCAVLAIGSVRAEMEDILDCRFPEPPVLPTGSSADLDAMDRAATDVRSFVDAMQKSLDCLDTKTNSLVVRARTTVLYNNGVEQMQAIATAFNNQLQIFRERESGKTARRGTESIGTNQVQVLENRSHH